MRIYHADSSRAAAKVTAAKPASPIVWCGGVSYIVLLYSYEYAAGPSNISNARIRVASWIGNLSFFDCLVQLEIIIVFFLLKRRLFNCIRLAFFVSNRKPAFSILVSDCMRSGRRQPDWGSRQRGVINSSAGEHDNVMLGCYV